MLEKLRVALWILRKYPVYKFRCWQSRASKERLHIYTSRESVEHIIAHRCSVARFGDGELQMISHYLQSGNKDNFGVDTFQDYDPRLGERLLEVLRQDSPDLLCCLPYQIKDSSISNLFGEVFWDREWLNRKDFLERYALDRQFGDTNFTRFYMGRLDIADYPDYIAALRRIWDGRDVLIIEGELSRLGVGNDLFEGCNSIRRVLCPKTNAFARYDEILQQTLALAEPNTLIILALGHTATVLAYDLSKAGYQALDLGHIDVEYEWYRMGAKGKVAIPGKYVNEVSAGRIQADSKTNNEHNKYQSEIVAHIH